MLGGGSKSWKRKPVLLVWCALPATAWCTFPLKTFPNFLTLTWEFFYLFYCTDTFGMGPQIRASWQQEVTICWGSEYEKGARMSWHYGSRVFCCTGWDSGGPETAMEGHPESQFPLHHFSSQCWAPSTWMRIPFSYLTPLPSMTKAKYHSETSAQMN